MPMAESICSAFRPSSTPAAMQGAKGVYCWPQTFAPRSALGCMARPMRVPTSKPRSMARMSCRPLERRASATASAAGMVTGPAWMQ